MTVISDPIIETVQNTGPQIAVQKLTFLDSINN